MKKLAMIISRLFDPINILAVIGVGAMVRSGNTQFLPVFVFGMVLPPFALLLWAVKTRRITNLDVSNRRQRIGVLSVFVFLLFFDFFIVKNFGNAYLLHIFSLFLLWFAGFFGVTLFWKISGHTSTLTVASFLVIQWFGWDWWPILLTIPLVSWARVKRKNHTFTQVVAGVLYSVSFIGFMRLTGLL